MNLTYSYCPRCAGPMVEQQVEGRNRPVCSECGLVIYRNPKVAAGVITVSDGKIALVRRAMNPSKGLWVFPGGYVDAGECVEDAARREVWEETGLTVRLERMLGVYSRDGDDVVLVVYTGQVSAGTLCAGDEELEAAWFGPDDIPPADQLGFWSTVQAISEWRSATAA